MPKNNSMKMRTNASLIPTSNFQIERTNFMSRSRMFCRAPLAEEGAAGQTFSTDVLAATRRCRELRREHFNRADRRSMARRGSLDPGARLVADPRQPDPAADPGD